MGDVYIDTEGVRSPTQEEVSKQQAHELRLLKMTVRREMIAEGLRRINLYLPGIDTVEEVQTLYKLAQEGAIDASQSPDLQAAGQIYSYVTGVLPDLDGWATSTLESIEPSAEDPFASTPVTSHGPWPA